MTPPLPTRTCILLTLCALVSPINVSAQKATQPAAATAAPPRDGSHDFDFEIGTWETRLRRLVNPLSGSTKWVEYRGTSVVRPVWDCRANLVELKVEGETGLIEGLALRLYDPAARQWSLNYSNVRSGTISPPTIGEFVNGRGVFFGQETLNGRAILVRFVISQVTPASAHFEQAFSGDGGETWELNWVADDHRISDMPLACRKG
jgi:hypothetical protein